MYILYIVSLMQNWPISILVVLSKSNKTYFLRWLLEFTQIFLHMYGLYSPTFEYRVIFLEIYLKTVFFAVFLSKNGFEIGQLSTT